MILIVFALVLSLAVPGTIAVADDQKNAQSDSEKETVTVTFDFNYEGAPEPIVIEAVKGQVIPEYSAEGDNTAPEKPTREGYRFAGWDSEPAPVLENGYSTTAWPVGEYFLSYYALFGDMSLANDGNMKPQNDITLYARWVEKTMISTPDELYNMRNDLSGWYELANDIDLSGYEWVPVGTYKSDYEWMNQPWWLEAFKGKLDGAGHIVTGLTLTTTEFYDVSADPENEQRNGCAGLFGATADGAEVCNLTLQNVKVDIKGKTRYNYIAPLIAFVEGCDISDCHVIGLDYHVSATDDTLATGMYNSLGGLVSGIWVGSITDSSVEGKMVVELISNRFHSGDNFIGGLVGDGYSDIDRNNANVDITVSYTNNCTDDYTRPDGEPTGIELVYATGLQKLIVGGLAGQSGSATNCTATGDVTIIQNSAVDNTLIACDALCGAVIGDNVTTEGSVGTGTVITP